MTAAFFRTLLLLPLTVSCAAYAEGALGSATPPAGSIVEWLMFLSCIAGAGLVLLKLFRTVVQPVSDLQARVERHHRILVAPDEGNISLVSRVDRLERATATAERLLVELDRLNQRLNHED